MSDIDTIVAWNAAVPTDQNISGIQIEVAKALAVVAISKWVILPPNPQAQRQVWSELPVILHIPRPLRPPQRIWIKDCSRFARPTRQPEQEISP